MSKYYPKKIHITVDVPVEIINKWNSDLNLKEASPDAGESDILDQITIDCGVYHLDRLEVDIKLVNGDVGPYLDCILFCEGCEVTTLNPGEGPLEGEYVFDAPDMPDSDGHNRQLTVSVSIRREGSSSAQSLLSGEHPSDGKPAFELFPDADFQCYIKVPSEHDGRHGDDILAQALARYLEAIEPMTRDEAIVLLSDVHGHLYSLHKNTGLSDPEPRQEVSSIVSKKFEELGWNPIDRWGF